MIEISKEIIDSIPDFETYLKIVIPPPKEGTEAYNFCEQWGYEQFLIKTQKYNIEQLRIMEAQRYNTMCLCHVLHCLGLDSTIVGIKEFAQGRPIVIAKMQFKQFITKVVKGSPGVLLWSKGDEHFCMFATYSYDPYVGYVYPEMIHVTGMTFESEKQMLQYSLVEEFKDGN